MLRLKATLVATTAARPWRTGWSLERGVDFRAPAPARPECPAAAPGPILVAAEPKCFIDEVWAAPPDATVVRRFTSLAAAAAGQDAGPDVATGTGNVRAWWLLAGKPPRT